MTPDCGAVSGRRDRARGVETYGGGPGLLVNDGVDRPLPESTDGVVEGEAGREDDSDRLVGGVIGPVKLAVVDEHGGREEGCSWGETR